MRKQGGVTAGDPWRALLHEVDIYRSVRLADEVVQCVTAQDIDTLIALTDAGDEKERCEALRIFIELNARRDRRLSETAKSRWLASARDLARTDFPRTRVSLPAFTAWRHTDRAGAETFLLKELDTSGLSADQLALVAAQLSSFGSEQAISMLEGLKGLPPEAERDRRAFLDAVRPLTESRRRELIREWEETRTNAALDRLFHALIRGWPEKPVRVKDLVAALGKPDRETSSGVGYSAKGEGLVIIADKKGFLESYDFA